MISRACVPILGGKRLLSGLLKNLDQQLFIPIHVSAHDWQSIDKLITTIKQRIQEIDRPVLIVWGTTDRLAMLAAILNQQLHLPVCSNLQATLDCQNKYLTRRKLETKLAQYTVGYCLVKPRTNLSAVWQQFRSNKKLFIKPVCSAVSYYAQTINNPDELSDTVSRYYKQPNNTMALSIHRLVNQSNIVYDLHGSSWTDLLAEECIPNFDNVQVTIDGWADELSHFYPIGITESVMRANTLSFDRFIYPAQLTDKQTQALYLLCQKVCRLFKLQNTFFNIEARFVNQLPKLIEINPRISAQFVYLFYKINGIHPFVQAYQLIHNHQWPLTNKQQAALGQIYILRKNQDARLLHAPSDRQLKKLEAQYDAEISLFLTPGKRLSQIKQDIYTYRYAQIKVVGKQQSAVDQKIQAITSHLESMIKWQPV